MKDFFKVLGVVTAVMAALGAALYFVDRLINNNRIENDYLDCDMAEDLQ